MKNKTLTFSQKISNHLTAVLIIFLIIVMVSINTIYGFSMKQQVISTQISEANYVSDILMHNLSSAVDCTNNIGISIYYTFKDYYIEDYYMSARVNNEIRNILEECTVFYKQADRLNVILLNGDLYTKESNGKLWIASEELESIKYLDDMSISAKGVWITDDSYAPLNSNEFISFVKPINNVNYNKQNGYIITQISKDTILDIYLNQSFGEYENFYLIGQDNQVISMHESFEGVGIEDVINNELDNSYCITKNLVIDDIVYYSLIDMNKVMHDLYVFSFGSCLFCFILIIVLRILIQRFSKKISQPFVILANHMISDVQSLPQKIELDTMARYSVRESDILVTSFNEMIEVIERLFLQVQEEGDSKQKLQFSLLFEQIKPHFLYNTLDSIYCLNQLNRIEESSQLTRTLAKFYRQTLSQGEEWVSIERELEIAKGYLEIQKVRYREKLEYEFQVSEEIYNENIPKLTIQPLIENAIYHGLKSQKNGGKIVIQGERMDGNICIKIKDNGIGFKEEQFREIMADGDQGESGFGLKSIASRLNLHYKNKSALYLESTEVGTTIVIYIENSKNEKKA